MIIFYNKRTRPLAVDFCRAGNPLITARFAPVAPQGEMQTLGEHMVALSPVRPTRAPRGAYSGGGMARNCDAIGSDLAPLARLPEEPNGVRTAPIPLRF